jgi:hypothetical protein
MRRWKSKMLKTQINTLDTKIWMTITSKETMDSTVKSMMTLTKTPSMIQKVSGEKKLNMSNGQSILKLS